MKLTGSNSPCQGQLEVHFGHKWHTVSNSSWSRSRSRSPSRWEDPKQASKLCQRLSCGDALVLAHIPDFNSPYNSVTCYGHLGSFSNCNTSEPKQRSPLGLICLGG